MEDRKLDIPEDLSINIVISSWEMPEIFKWIAEEGKISLENMYRIFNCGIGMVIFVEESDAQEISDSITSLNFKNFIIGKVTEKTQENSVIFS